MLSPGISAPKINPSSTAEDASSFPADPETFNYGDIFDSFVSENAYAFPDSSKAEQGLLVTLPQDVPAGDLPALGGEDVLDMWSSADNFNSVDASVADVGVNNLNYTFDTTTTAYSPSHTSIIHNANVVNTDGQGMGQSNVNSPHCDIRMSSEIGKAAEITRLEQELEEIELRKREIALKRRLEDLHGANGTPEDTHTFLPATSGNPDPIEPKPGKGSREGCDLEVRDFEMVFPSIQLNISQSSFDQNNKIPDYYNYDLSGFGASSSHLQSAADCHLQALETPCGSYQQQYPAASPKPPNSSSNVTSQALVRRKRPRSPGLSYPGYLGVILECGVQREESIASIGSQKRRQYSPGACYVCKITRKRCSGGSPTNACEECLKLRQRVFGRSTTWTWTCDVKSNLEDLNIFAEGQPKWRFQRRSGAGATNCHCDAKLLGFHATYDPVASNNNNLCLKLSDIDALCDVVTKWTGVPGRDMMAENVTFTGVFFKLQRLKEMSLGLRYCDPELNMSLERFYAASSQFTLASIENITCKIPHERFLPPVIFFLVALYEEVKDDRLEYKISKDMASHLMQAILCRLHFFSARYFSHGHRRFQQPQKTPDNDEGMRRQLGAWVFRATGQFPVLPVDHGSDPNLKRFPSITPTPCFFSQVQQKTLPRLLPRDEVQQNLVTGDHVKCSRLLARMMRSDTLKFYGYTCESLANEFIHSDVNIMAGQHRIKARTNYRALTKLAFHGSLRPDIENAERLCLLADVFKVFQNLCLMGLGHIARPLDGSISQELIRNYASALRRTIFHISFTKSLEMQAAFLMSKKEQIQENHGETIEVFIDWLQNDPDGEVRELTANCYGQMDDTYEFIYQELPADTTPCTIEWDLASVPEIQE